MSLRSPVTPYLVEETTRMMRQQRVDEQAGKRGHAPVHAEEHADDYDEQKKHGNDLTQDGEQENAVPSHPFLDRQLFDGADKHLSIDPTINPNAEMEIKNAENKQQEELRLRLGLQMQPGRYKTPTPGSSFGA